MSSAISPDDLIWRKDALKAIVGSPNDLHYPGWYIDAINGVPGVEQKKFIWCKDCKYRDADDFCTGRGYPNGLVPDDGFCDKGERREDGAGGG